MSGKSIIQKLVGGAETGGGDMEARLASMREASTALANRLDSMESVLREIMLSRENEQEAGELPPFAEELSARLEAIEAKLTGTGAIAARLADAEKRLAKYEADSMRLAQLEAGLPHLHEQELSGIAGTLENLAHKVEASASAGQEVSSLAAELERLRGETRESVARTDNGIKELAAAVSVIRQDGTLEAKLADFKTAMESIADGMSANIRKLEAEMARKVSDSSAKIAEQGAEAISKLGQQLQESKSLHSSLREELDTLRSTTEANAEEVRQSGQKYGALMASAATAALKTGADMESAMAKLDSLSAKTDKCEESALRAEAGLDEIREHWNGMLDEHLSAAVAKAETRIGESVTALRNDLKNIEADLASQAAAMAAEKRELDTRLALLQEQTLKSAEADLSSRLGKTATEISAHFEELERGIAQASESGRSTLEQIAETRQDMAKAAAATEENLAAAQRRVDELDGKMVRMGEEIDSRSKAAATGTGRLIKEETLALLAELRKELDGKVAASAETAHQQWENAAKLSASLSGQISNSETKLARNFSSVSARMLEMEAKVDRMSDKMSNLDADISREVASTVQRSGADILHCMESLGRLDGRINDLQGRLESGSYSSAREGSPLKKTEALEARLNELQEVSSQAVAQIKTLLGSSQGGWADVMALPAHVKNMSVEMTYMHNKVMRQQARMDDFESRFGQFLMASRQISAECQNFVDHLRTQLGHTANLLPRREEPPTQE